jgi:hypothetical protein
MTRMTSDKAVEERIGTMWKVHKNRVDRGLDGTFSSTGVHESFNLQDTSMILPTLTISSSQIFDSVEIMTRINNPFNRWHEAFNKDPHHLSDIDNYPIVKVDEYERTKKLKPKKEHTFTAVDPLPRVAHYESPEPYDITGQSLYSTPPDSQILAVDHGLDEEKIWNFELTQFNQNIVTNQYFDPYGEHHTSTHAPFWGKKLATMIFYKSEKMDKFFRHWHHRIGLENLKKLQVIKYGLNPSDQQLDQM